MTTVTVPPGLFDGVDGVVDQVEQNLLDLGRRGLDLGQVRTQLGDDLDIGVAGFLACQTDDLDHHVVERHRAYRGVGLAREAQKFVGDLLATIALGPDLADGSVDLDQVLLRCGVVVLQEIVDPARLLDHDRHRVVDLVGDPRGEFADGGETAGFDDLVGHDGPFAIGLGKLGGEISRDKETHGEGHGCDGQQGDDGKTDDLSHLFEGIGGLLLVAEQPSAPV